MADSNGDPTVELAGLKNELVQINDNLRAENDKRDKRIAQHEKTQRQLKVVAVSAILVAFLGVVVGVLGLTQASTANEAASKANRALAATTSNGPGSVRAVACQQYNKQQKAGIAADQATFEGILPYLIADPAQREATRKQFELLIVSKHTLRDCSTEGITAYLAHP